MASSRTREYQNSYSRDQIYKVLTAAGIQIYSESVNDFIVFCPWHHNVNTPAAEVSHETGQFFCFSCKHTASLIDYVCRAAGLEYFQVVRMIAKYKDDQSIVDLVDSALVKKDFYKPTDTALIERLNASALSTDRALEYLRGRGITRDSVERFKIGYSEKQDMVTFPFPVPGRPGWLGFEARSIEGKQFLCQGNKSQTLFNLHKNAWKRRIWIVESSIDCILLEQAGVPTVGTMGSNRSNAQVDLLKRYFNEVVVVQDNDDAENDFAGQASAKKLLEKLGPRGIIVAPPSKFKDVGDMSTEERQTFVDSINDQIERLVHWD